jgi:hypothetical protein
MYDPASQTWNGTFTNRQFSGHVSLRRPATKPEADAPLGSWRIYSQDTIWSKAQLRVADYACLHIGMGADGTLVLWPEYHNVMDRGWTQNKPVFGNIYGELSSDSESKRGGGGWSFIVGNQMGGYRVTGTLSSDRTAFGGYISDYYGNGIRPTYRNAPFVWTREPDGICSP